MGSSISTKFIIVFLVFLCGYLLIQKQRSYYSDKHPVLDKLRESLAKLDPEYAKIPLKIGTSAYTENKETITMCLQDPKTGEYYDWNTLTYVLLHEVAHLISKHTKGHEGEFPANFAKLLVRATKAGIYDPRKGVQLSYCGTGPNN